MKKTFCFTLALLLGMGALPGLNALAAEYPERAIEILVPFGAGGGSDTAARAVAEGLKPQLKNGLVVNNMPGGGATTGVFSSVSVRTVYLSTMTCVLAVNCSGVVR